MSLVDRIDALLPQTQCTRCGYPSCAEYARAIAEDGEAINRCPPGGEAGIAALGSLLGQPLRPLDPDCGQEGPRWLAFIESDDCIGCTKCIRACPVDAIIGGPKAMHTVLPALCSGCELCVPPCPTDCIRIVPANAPWTDTDAREARLRFDRRQARLSRERDDDRRRHERELTAKLDLAAPQETRRREVLAAALARARARLGARDGHNPDS